MTLQELKDKITRQLSLTGEYAIFCGRALREFVSHPPRYLDVVDQMDSLGFQSVVILVSTGLFIGLALTALLEAEMAMFGAKTYVGRMLAVATVRELGPVIASLMLAGRVGARVASELGAMRVTQQIDSIEGLGQDPMRKLVLPRIGAMLVMTPALTMLTDLVVILGGFLISTESPGIFWFEARKAFTPRHLSGGMLKPFVFGFIISSISCFVGMRASQGVRGVGQASANAVVISSVVIFLMNFIIGYIVLKIFGV